MSFPCSWRRLLEPSWGGRSVASANETISNSSCEEGRGTLLFKVSLPAAREAGADRSVEELWLPSKACTDLARGAVKMNSK